MTVAEALREGRAVLAAAGIDGAAQDARWLLAHVLGTDPGLLAARRSDPLTPDQETAYSAALKERARHRPVAQITGHRAFWGHDFRVTSDVLDPRPETETLIAEALAGRTPHHVLDLGTGTGALLLTCLLEWPEARGTGTDLSAAALAVARDNAARLGCAARARFVETHWLTGITGPFDLVLCNPPYIRSDEMADLAPDVRDWEPHLALTPGGDGLAPYRSIALGLRDIMAPNGRALFEFGHRQATDVAAIFAATHPKATRILKDLNGHDRGILLDF